MASGGDRDRAVERLLKTSLGDGLAASSPDCLDAERLAAWSEGGLTPPEIRTIDAHLAACARCQSMAAVFVRTAPAAVVSVVPARAWRLHWLTPFAVAAAAAGLWFLVPHGVPTPPVSPGMPEQTLARQELKPAEASPALEVADKVASAAPVESPLRQPPGGSVDTLARRRELDAKAVAELPAGQNRTAAPVASPPPPPPAVTAPAPAPPSAAQAAARSETTGRESADPERVVFWAGGRSSGSGSHAYGTVCGPGRRLDAEGGRCGAIQRDARRNQPGCGATGPGPERRTNESSSSRSECGAHR